MSNIKQPELRSIDTKILPNKTMNVYLQWSNETTLQLEIKHPYVKLNVLDAFISLLKLIITRV